MTKPTRLCRIDTIGDPGSRQFSAETADGRQNIMLIRHGWQVFAYTNSCPHTGVPLDWQPGKFLNLEQTHIVCAMHGAEFRIEDGYCVSGPCRGDSLAGVPVRVNGDWVELLPGHAPAGHCADHSDQQRHRTR